MRIVLATQANRIALQIAWAVMTFGVSTWSCGGTERASSPAAGSSAPSAADTAQRTIAVSAGHTCVLRRAGVYCWGDNFAGQLGTGDTRDSPQTPIKSLVASADIVELAADSGRTCARRATGELACWGANDHGQIGDGTRSDKLIPVSVQALHDARQLALDGLSTCALRADASVACWGASPADAPEQGSLQPMPVAGLDAVVELRGGALGTYCARGRPGWVRCWQLTDGAWTAPIEVPTLADARAIAVTFQDEVCGITPDDEIRCHNLQSGNDGALGTSQGAVELVSGPLSLCARKQTGQWSCWNVLPSMLETAGSPEITVTTDVPLVELSIGGLKACAVRSDHAVVCGDANTLASPIMFGATGASITLERVDDLPD